MSVLALSTAPAAGAALQQHEEITLIAGVGIVGDRHAGHRRSVTIVCSGELADAAAELRVESIDGVPTRRNIVVDAPALPRTHGTVFRIGDVGFEVWRDCAPCELMNETFGDGAKDALQQRCGISATVVTDGIIRVGDPIDFDAPPSPTS